MVSSHQDEQYQSLISRMLKFAFENKDNSFAIELQSEGAKLGIVNLDKTLDSIKITDDLLLRLHFLQRLNLIISRGIQLCPLCCVFLCRAKIG